MKNKSVSKRIKKSLSQFAKDLEAGDLSKYRVTKMVTMEDGTVKRVISQGAKLAKGD